LGEERGRSLIGETELGKGREGGSYSFIRYLWEAEEKRKNRGPHSAAPELKKRERGVKV